MIRHRHQTILGDIPRDWDACALGSLLADELSGDWGDDEGEVSLSVLRSTNFTDSGNLKLDDVAKRGFTRSKAAQVQVQPNDILVERSGGGPSQPVGRVAMIREGMPDTGFANFVQTLRPDATKISPELLLWTLHQLNRSGLVEKLQHQTTQMRNLDLRDYLKVLVPVPADREEQTRIAETLKAADDHVRALEEQIRKAKRVFRALLNDLFNGLRSAPKIKGRQCFTLHGSVNFDDGVTFTPEGQTAYFKVDDFNSPGNERQLVSSAARIAIDPGSKSVPFEVGNVIFAKRGAALTKNRVRINAVPCFLDPNLMLMRPIPGVAEAAFLRYYLMRFRLEKLGEDAGIPQLNNKDLYPKEFPIPSQTERDSICQALSAAEDLVDSVNAQLLAARRVKQSLLQNLLTGKVRLKP
jgi:type I restriction enzyme, S subunit